MDITSRHRLLRFTLMLGALAGSACDAFAQSQTNTFPPGVVAKPPDEFYDLPAKVPARPGVLLRSEELKDVTLPGGMRGLRILYTTTVDDRTRATAVATIFVPTKASHKPYPVIAWEHGTTGAPQKCMPSLLSAPTLGIPALERVVAAGWVIVATDYSFAEKNGPHPYLIGEGEARAALDSVRAARQVAGLMLDRRTVVWGHSQGGHASLWTGIVGPHYAPDVNIAGIAAIAPAADPANILKLNPIIDKNFGPYVALAYSRFYSHLTFEQALRPEALAAGREIAKLCAILPPEDPVRIAALIQTFDGVALTVQTNTRLAALLAQNAADHPIAAPLLIAQGLADTTVPPPASEAYVAERCKAGQRLDFLTFKGVDHLGIVAPGSPLDEPLAAWTAARFANEHQAKGCARKSF
jgi:acetyl esterase/lipase